MAAMPERPASRFSQPSATLLPTGLISPRPVTTTRREFIRNGELARSGSLLVLRCIIDRELDRRDLLGFLVGNLDPELVLERHHEFDRVERVGTQVGDERLFVRHVGLGNSELLGDDLLDSCIYVAHDSSGSVKKYAILRCGDRLTGAWQAPFTTS